MKAKLSTLARRLEELEMRNQHEVRAVAEALIQIQPCFICQSTDHQGEHCLTAPSVRDLMTELWTRVFRSRMRPHSMGGTRFLFCYCWKTI